MRSSNMIGNGNHNLKAMRVHLHYSIFEQNRKSFELFYHGLNIDISTHAYFINLPDIFQQAPWWAEIVPPFHDSL